MKRQRQEENESQAVTDNNGNKNGINSSNTMSTTDTTIDATDNNPAYGLQEYWEKRYKRNQERKQITASTSTRTSDIANTIKKSNKTDKNSEDINDTKSISDDDDISPGHVWYFTYQELKSLILPLILDDRGDEFDQCSENSDDDDVNDDDVDEDGWEEVEEDGSLSDNNSNNNGCKYDNGKDSDIANGSKEEDVGQTGTNQLEKSNKCTEYDVNYSEIYKSKIENEAQFQPKKILEIGCGDVPLGSDICHHLLQFQSITGVNAQSVVEQIICFDYSTTVIDLLTQNHNSKTEDKAIKDDTNHLKVEYSVMDARKLPFKDNQFNLILDKGTLDAMISDKNEGINNCVQVVSEASRLLASGGYLLIVSHLNACNSEGLSWVNEVLVMGLKEGDQKCDWRIEVHSSDDGSEMDVAVDKEENMGTKEKDYGPAVYIIQKKEVSENISKQRVADGKNESKVTLKFFGY